ncbi:MAG: hypothetical protein ACRCX2_38135 [Paraclostridium sp.]
MYKEYIENRIHFDFNNRPIDLEYTLTHRNDDMIDLDILVIANGKCEYFLGISFTADNHKYVLRNHLKNELYKDLDFISLNATLRNKIKEIIKMYIFILEAFEW